MRIKNNNHMRLVLVMILAGMAIVSHAQTVSTRLDASTLTWEELAAHSGLYGLHEKAPEQFGCDLVNDLGSVLYIRAEIHLTDEDWKLLNRDDTFSLVRPWKKGSVSVEDWKGTVDMILPNGGNVSTDILEFNDPAVVLRRETPKSVRVYILKENPKDKRKLLYYFYKRL